MERNFQALRHGLFDLLVVGGGIYGAWSAYDAALRGLRVAIVEKRDWASATSSASSKLIHGGLRYLEHGRLRLVRKGLAERRLLSRLGPHRIRPLRFALPVYAGDRVGRWRLRAGLWLYDRLAGGNQPVAPHRYLDRDALLREVALDGQGLEGGFTFGDCQTDDARLTLELIDGAVRAGAVAVNRAAARRLLRLGDRVGGAEVEDVETAERVEVRATVTADCSAAWSGRWSASASGAIRVRRTKGVHLVMPALGGELALLIVSNLDDRIVFLIPWYGRTLLGTTDTEYDGDPDAVRVERSDVSYLLERANRALPGRPWSESDVISSFAGLRTLPMTGERSPSAVTREWRLAVPGQGLLVPIGGKLTSARADAAILVDRAIRIAGLSAGPTRTAERPLPWCPEQPFEAWHADVLHHARSLGIDEETAQTCTLRYGNRVERLFERIAGDASLARRIVPDAPFCRAEIEHAVAEEMACDLEDVLRRRVPLLLVSRLSDDALREAASQVGALAGWSEERRHEEVRTLAARIRPAVPTREPA